MNQHEAVTKAMKKNGGYATLGFLYHEALMVPGVKWGTKTPFASIRRIIQDANSFEKIRPGLYVLRGWENKLPSELRLQRSATGHAREEFNHSYYQGLTVEVGNLKGYETFVPDQDKNRGFLGKKLVDVITVQGFYHFTFDEVIRRAKTIDVTWFNKRKMPAALFEVEHSTDIQNSLLKFLELQDFNTQMYIVADEVRKREYQGKLNLSAFTPIRGRVNFLSYEKLVGWHEKVNEFFSVERKIFT